MRMSCPQCARSFENCLQCPNCHVPLQFRKQGQSAGEELAAFAGSDAYRSLPGLVAQVMGSERRWLSWPMLRLLVGFVLAAALSAMAMLWVLHVRLW